MRFFLLLFLLPITCWASYWGPVDLASGALHLHIVDHVVDGLNPIVIDRFHRSEETYDDIGGYWHVCEERIYLQVDKKGKHPKVVVQLSNGDNLLFEPIDQLGVDPFQRFHTTFLGPPGYALSFARHPYHFQLTLPDGQVRIYKLISERHKPDHSVAEIFGLSQVGDYLFYHYTDEGALSRIETEETWAQFNYTGSLASVQTSDGQSLHFGYTSLPYQWEQHKNRETGEKIQGAPCGYVDRLLGTSHHPLVCKYRAIAKSFKEILPQPGYISQAGYQIEYYKHGTYDFPYHTYKVRKKSRQYNRVYSLKYEDESWYFEYGSPDHTGMSWTCVYDGERQLVARYCFDREGRVVSVSDSKNGMQFKYTPKGSIAQVLCGKERVVYQYDSNERCIGQRLPGGNHFHYSYDSSGTLVGIQGELFEASLSSIFDEDGTQVDVDSTRYRYDNQGGLIAVEGASASIEALSDCEFIYLDPSQRPIHILLNEDGRPLLVEGEDQQLYYQYDEHGLLESVSDGAQEDSWIYDDEGRLTSQWRNGQLTQYQYDIEGRLSCVTKPSGRQVHYQFDSQGRLARLKAHDLDYTYHYDSEGRLVGAGDLSFAYDSANRLIEEVLPDGNCLAFGYTSDGLLSELTYPEGTQVSFAYNNGRLSTVDGVSLGYSKHGELTGIGDQAYTYDDQGRMTSTPSQTLVWDDHGNLLSDGTQDFQYDSHDRLLLAQTTDELEYDLDGRLVWDGEHTYRYDALDRLTAIDEIEITYDALGRRLTVDGQTLLHLGRIDIGSMQGEKLHYRTLAQGRTITIDGQLTASDLLGSPQTASYGFANMRVTSAIAHFGYRDLHLPTQTFLTPDPVYTGLNPYDYCHGNPYRYSDPLGLSCDLTPDPIYTGSKSYDYCHGSSCRYSDPMGLSGDLDPALWEEQILNQNDREPYQPHLIFPSQQEFDRLVLPFPLSSYSSFINSVVENSSFDRFANQSAKAAVDAAYEERMRNPRIKTTKRGVKIAILFVNGIWNKPRDACENAARLASATGLPVKLVHNPSSGYAGDLVKSYWNTYCPSSTMHTKITDAVEAYFDEAGDDAILIIVAHSAGTIHAVQYLSTASPKRSKQIVYFALAPAQFAPSKLASQVLHFVSPHDPVPSWATINWTHTNKTLYPLENRHYVYGMGFIYAPPSPNIVHLPIHPADTNKSMIHAFFSDTYFKPLVRNIKTTVRSH